MAKQRTHNNQNTDAPSFDMNYSCRTMPPLRKKNLSFIARGGTALFAETFRVHSLHEPARPNDTTIAITTECLFGRSGGWEHFGTGRTACFAHERTRNGRGLRPWSARAVRSANVAELREARQTLNRPASHKVKQSACFALRASRAH